MSIVAAKRSRRKEVVAAVEDTVQDLLGDVVPGMFGRGVPHEEPTGDEIWDGTPDVDVLKQILEDLYQSHLNKRVQLPKPARVFLGQLRDGDVQLVAGALDRGLQLVETYRPSSLRAIYEGGQAKPTVASHIVDVASGRVKAGTLNERVPLTPNHSPRSTVARGEKRDAMPPNGTVVELAIGTLHTLPENPEPNPDRIQELAESIQSRGLDEPLIVRPASCCDEYVVPENQCQVLSGATRLAACKRLNLIMVPCRIRTDIFSKGEALAFAAGTNADRREISDWERAHWLQQLHDSGWTDTQSAAVYHISREQCTNLRRLLKVPAVWRQRVESGEVLLTVVRDGILPYVHAPKVMRVFDDVWADDHDREDTFWGTVKEQIARLHEHVHDSTRPLNVRGKPFWFAGEHWPVYVEADDPEVCPETVPLLDEKTGKVVEQLVATDSEAWERKQKAACQEKLEERAKRAAKKAERSPSPPAPLAGASGRVEKGHTVASDRRPSAGEAKRDADQARAELAGRIDQWSRVALLWATADRLKRISDETLQMQYPVLVFRVIGLVCKMGHARYVSRAFHHASTGRWPSNAYDQGDPWREIQAAVNRGGRSADDGVAGLRIARDAAAVLLFTPERVQNKNSLVINWSDGETAAAAVDQGVSLEDVWYDARVIDSEAYHLVTEFFGLHTMDQLQQLAEHELEASSLVEECRTKKELLAGLMVAHNGEGLPFPKSLRG